MKKKNKKKPEKAKHLKSADAPISQFEQVEEFLSGLYDIRNNIISNEIEFKLKGADEFEPLNENNIYRLLQHHNIRFSMGNLISLLKSDFVEKHNPFEEYFKALPKWDGKDHIADLCSYVKVKNQERFNNHFRKMLIRSIACSLRENFFNKQMFLMMGGQNCGKSTFLRWLCPAELKEFYMENISTDKDSLIALCGNFMINMDELAGLQKFELRALKSILSKDRVKIRLPYDKRPTSAPRRANFVGSTNEMEFLTDVTGTVRWLCFEVQEINFNYSKKVEIQKIWSQAFHLYNKGEDFAITAAEIEENEKVNVQHQITTVEQELIQKYFNEGKPDKDGAVFMTATEVMTHFIKAEGTHLRINNISLGKAMTHLKFEKYEKRQTETGIPQKGYWVICACKGCEHDRANTNALTNSLNKN